MARRSKTITYNGERLTFHQWAQRLGCSQQVLRERLRLGWSVERTLTTPTPCIKQTAADEAFNTLVLDIDHALRAYQSVIDSMKRDRERKRKAREEAQAGGADRL